MNIVEAFDGVYRGKTVLVTGHTGFKGSWLIMWLLLLGARVVGYSLYLPSKPSIFEVCRLQEHITDEKEDIRDFTALSRVIHKYRPEIIFHLAAQPLVTKSYDNAKYTFDTNVGGTVNILESLKDTTTVRAAVLITSDKCYKNVEWVWGYREIDELGGGDPYSASKACSELVCRSYASSFFLDRNAPRIATARAGNVIGGGDWAESRIIPDCVRAFSSSEQVVIRNPTATRPWQHVLEPLSGYLLAGAELFRSRGIHGEAFNFGPSLKADISVQELLQTFARYWGDVKWQFEKDHNSKRESTLLRLNCDKALQILKWHPVLIFDDTARLTAEWYKAHYQGCANMHDFSNKQIVYYFNKAKEIGLHWAKMNKG